MFTSLTSGSDSPEDSEVGVSSLMDVWLLLRNLESNGERNRGLYVLKARGLAHSNQIREFVLTDRGVQLLDVYVGPAGLLTGSARIAQNARERADAEERKEQLQRQTIELKNKREQLESQIARMRADFAVEEQVLMRNLRSMELRQDQIARNQIEMGEARKADPVSSHNRARAARSGV